MEGTGKKIGGFFAMLAVVAGILLLTGVIGPKTGSMAKILHGVGIGCVVVGAVVVLLVIAIVIIAFATNKDDPDTELKAGANQVISDRKKQLSKLKSQASIMKMNVSSTKSKIKSLDARIELCEKNAEKYVAAGDDDNARSEITKKQELAANRETLIKSRENYDNSLAEIQRAIDSLECEIAELGNRRDSAMTKMKIAKVNQNVAGMDDGSALDEDAFDKLDEKAQYEEDYAESMKELNRTSKY